MSSPHYTATKVQGSGDQSIAEIASALNFGSKWPEILCDLLSQGPMKLFGQFDLKELGSGDVASNLRYKHDATINNQVIKNTLDLLTTVATKPITITSVSRTERYKSFQFLPDGTVTVTNNASKEVIPEDTILLTEFLKGVGVTEEKMKVLRESTKGARYNSYLADILSFIYMIDSHFHPEMFDRVVKVPTVYNTTTVDQSGEPLLKSFVKDGKEWIPKEKFDYLYFNDPGTGGKGVNFIVPKDGSIGKVYYQMNELLSMKESGMKEMVRNFFGLHGSYTRFSDYWVNDVDDGFTILMILNAYSYTTLTHEEERVKGELEKVVSEIF